MNPKDQKDQKDQKNPNDPSRTGSSQKAGGGNWNDKSGGDAPRKSPGGQPDQSGRKTTDTRQDDDMDTDGGSTHRNQADGNRSQRDPND